VGLLLNPHLDDAAFADVWAERLTVGEGAESSRSAEDHLRICAECRGRYAAFSAWLESTRADAFAEADEVFSAERLTNQQAQIFRRLEALEHPARVIAFPRFARPISAQPTGRRRLIAAAAAAGLVAGVGLGQLLEFRRSVGREVVPTPEQTTARGNTSIRENVRLTLQPVSQASDEIFLYEPESTSSQARVPESLQYLNQITPGARDYDPK
jgi:hypothetical protein